MDRKLVIALSALTAVGLAGGAFYISTSSAAADGPNSGDCTTVTDGQVVVTIGGVVTDFQPDCVLIQSGDRVTWTNLDIIPHDPGDGELGDDFSKCFQSKNLGGVIGPNESFSANFHFNGTHVILRDVTDTNGNIVDAELVCSNDPLLKVWHRNADGDVVIPYICHIHEDNMDGFIIIDDTP